MPKIMVKRANMVENGTAPDDFLPFCIFKFIIMLFYLLYKQKKKEEEFFNLVYPK